MSTYIYIFTCMYIYIYIVTDNCLGFINLEVFFVKVLLYYTLGCVPNHLIVILVRKSMLFFLTSITLKSQKTHPCTLFFAWVMQ